MAIDRYCLVLLGLLASAANASTPAHQWRSYTNVRFEYSICYPGDLLTPDPEAPNGDGRVFNGPAGARLSVWGSLANGRTPASELREDVHDVEEKGGRITYKVLRPGWFAFSARQGRRIVYQKTVLDHDTLRTFELEYPETAAAIWDPVATATGACFRGRA